MRSHAHLLDVYGQLRLTAAALDRLLRTFQDISLDPDQHAAFQEQLDDIGVRVIRHTERVNDLLVQAHQDRRMNLCERRLLPDRRKPT